jgi:hypothetical protein
VKINIYIVFLAACILFYSDEIEELKDEILRQFEYGEALADRVEQGQAELRAELERVEAEQKERMERHEQEMRELERNERRELRERRERKEREWLENCNKNENE